MVVTQQMTQVMTEPPKLTKQYLMAVMRKQLEARTFNREQFKQQYGIADRKARRYINDVAKEFGAVQSDSLIFLKNYCVDNLLTKAINGELDESTEAKIALSGDTTKIELDINQKVSVKKQIDSLIKFSSDVECKSKE
jgi:hypothetical protein